MPCFHPRDIVVKKPRLVYQWTKLPNGKVVREKDSKGCPIVLGVESQYTIQVPCGKCAACLALAQSQWSFRIEQEALNGGHASVLFVTFTYDNEHLPKDFCVHKEEIQKYLHDLRQNLYRTYFDGTDKESVPKLKYYFCAEYGSKFGRPHYHSILFFSKSVDWKIIQTSWSRGIVDIRPFSSARAGYVAKYTVKDINLDYAGRERPFHLQSQGLGKCFLEKHHSFQSLSYNTYFSNLSGRKVKLPRYYLDKLGTERKYYSLVEIDGTSKKRSSTYHSFDFNLTNEYARYRFLEYEEIERMKLGPSVPSFELYKRKAAEKLEHELSVLNKKSSYYVLSRFESSTLQKLAGGPV